jgi:hypothetical protein
VLVAVCDLTINIGKSMLLNEKYDALTGKLLFEIETDITFAIESYSLYPFPQVPVPVFEIKHFLIQNNFAAQNTVSSYKLYAYYLLILPNKNLLNCFIFYQC